MLTELSGEERETLLGAMADLNHRIARAIQEFTEASGLGVYGATIQPEWAADGSVSYSMSIKIDALPERQPEGDNQHGSL